MIIATQSSPAEQPTKECVGVLSSVKCSFEAEDQIYGFFWDLETLNPPSTLMGCDVHLFVFFFSVKSDMTDDE